MTEALSILPPFTGEVPRRGEGGLQTLPDISVHDCNPRTPSVRCADTSPVNGGGMRRSEKV